MKRGEGGGGENFKLRWEKKILEKLISQFSKKFFFLIMEQSNENFFFSKRIFFRTLFLLFLSFFSLPFPPPLPSYLFHNLFFSLSLPLPFNHSSFSFLSLSLFPNTHIHPSLLPSFLLYSFSSYFFWIPSLFHILFTPTLFLFLFSLAPSPHPHFLLYKIDWNFPRGIITEFCY